MTSLKETIRSVETAIHRGQPRILIADDEPDMLKYLKSQLSISFQVIEAVDGQQAVEKASQFLPDVIVCDMMMPEKNGLEVCRELRERTSTRSIPILCSPPGRMRKQSSPPYRQGQTTSLPSPFPRLS